jgi:hypothetical protein
MYRQIPLSLRASSIKRFARLVLKKKRPTRCPSFRRQDGDLSAMALLVETYATPELLELP